jgi:hypothetical protein
MPLRKNAGLLLVLLAALLATTVKIAWALHSAGSCDVVFFFGYGQALGDATLAQLYAGDPMFNHTPATGLLAAALYRMARAEYATFAALFRLISIAADLGLIAALLWLRRRTGRPPWWALVFFAASPVSIMVSGFHGNVDPLMVLCLTWAAVAVVARRPALSGALFAAACNVKVVPIVLAPVFLAWWWQHDRRGLLRFSLTAGALLLAGNAIPLIQYPALYLQKVFGYGSYWGSWGITYWLRDTGLAAFQKFDFQELSSAQVQVAWLLKALIVGAIAAVAWRRRAVEDRAFLDTLTAAFALVFVFAPGAGPQYLVWTAPFLAWSAPRWYALITLCSAAFMASFYHSTADWHFPWDLAYPNGWEYIFWGPWTNLPWVAFCLLLAVHARAWWTNATQRAVPT